MEELPGSLFGQTTHNGNIGLVRRSLMMEGDFPIGYDTLKWEIGEDAYDEYLEIFDRFWGRVY